MKAKITRHLNGLVLVAVFLLTAQLVQAQTNWGTALQFDGVDDSITVDSGVTLANTSFTVEFWAKRSNINSWDQWVVYQGTTAINMDLHIGFRANRMTFGFWGAGNDVAAPAATMDLAWHHYSLTYNIVNGIQTIFCDGSPVISNIPSGPYQGYGPLSIGWRMPHATAFFGGTLDEVRIWNVARTEAEIQANMLQSLTGTEPGLVAYYRFDEGEGTTAYDATANANDGPLINGPVWARHTPAHSDSQIKILDFDMLPTGLITELQDEGFSIEHGNGDKQTIVNVSGTHQNILRDSGRFNGYGSRINITRIDGGSFYVNSLEANNAGSSGGQYWIHFAGAFGGELQWEAAYLHPNSATWTTYNCPNPDMQIDILFVFMMSLQADFGIDNISLSVLTPLAYAGPDQTVSETPWHIPTVQLDGSLSMGGAIPTEALTCQWTQIAGPAVALSDATVCNPTFIAPLLPADSTQVLTFKLEVGDDQQSSEDFVDITVNNNNHAPVCIVPDPFEVAEASPAVELIGSASYDPDDDTLTYSWVQDYGPQTIIISGADTANATFEAPWSINGGGDILVSEIYQFSLTVNDGQLSDSSAVIVEINNLNHFPTADAGPNRVVAEGESCTLSGLASSDPDNDQLLYTWQQINGPEVSLDDPYCATPWFVIPWVNTGGADLVFALTVDDQYGGADTKSVLIHVDNIGDPPSCIDAQPSIAELWPPNHKMISIGIENIGTGGLPTTTVITGVSQDEPSNGLGDGDTACDAVFSDDTSKVMLRAERAGSGNGRVYHVAFTATNEQGSCAGVVQVGVPLSKKKGAVCVDEGALYPSAP